MMIEVFGDLWQDTLRCSAVCITAAEVKILHDDDSRGVALP